MRVTKILLSELVSWEGSRFLLLGFTALALCVVAFVFFMSMSLHLSESKVRSLRLGMTESDVCTCLGGGPGDYTWLNTNGSGSYLPRGMPGRGPNYNPDAASYRKEWRTDETLVITWFDGSGHVVDYQVYCEIESGSSPWRWVRGPLKKLGW